MQHFLRNNLRDVNLVHDLHPRHSYRVEEIQWRHFARNVGTGLLETDDIASQVRLLQLKQLAALTATGLQKEGRGNYMGRGRGRG